MDMFIKVSLVGNGWSKSELGKQKDYQKFANILSSYFSVIAPLDGKPAESRSISIAVCAQVDNVHFIDSDQQILISV